MGSTLTLRYISPVADEERAPLQAATRAAAALAGPFEVELVTAGSFPNARRPRALWVGATRGADELGALNVVVDEAVERAGYGHDRGRSGRT